jgi:hypothetical protein
MSEERAMTASEYRALVRAKRDTQPSEIVTMPSGMKWELRRPNLEAYMITGHYPQSLVNAGIKALKARGIAPDDPEATATVTKALGEDKISDALIFMRELVREACVNPRIVIGASGDDEIDPSEIDIEDFNFIVSWCMDYKGVKGAAGVSKFRTGRKGRTAARKPHGKKLRLQTV